MKLWKWQAGRQHGTDYKKFPLWYFKIGKWGFDAYILKYEPNTTLDKHTDPVKNGKHWRMNIKVKGNADFNILKPRIHPLWGQINQWEHTTFPITFFRPDLHEHILVVGDKGCTKLSLGFVKFD